jgi:hypothetical protein
MITFADIGTIIYTLCYVVSVFILIPLLGIALLLIGIYMVERSRYEKQTNS